MKVSENPAFKNMAHHTIPYRIIFAIGIVISVLMAWNSEGFYHYDEHYQIIEFAQYKAGKAVPEGLAWEFHEKIRPGLQPFFAYLVLKASYSMGFNNPFQIAFLLRLMSLALSLFVAYHFGKWISKESELDKASNLFWILTLFFWCSSFLMVRFSSENFGGLAFVSGIILLSGSGKRNYVLAGVLFGLAFQFRYQMAFAVIGYLGWFLIQRKYSLKIWSWILSGGIMATLLGLVLDYWLYGSWQFTAINYFTSNIIDDKASDFGVSPWYFYFKSLFLSLGPILNVVAIILLVCGVVLWRNHPVVWSLILFFIGHVVVPHKEMRFMFPMWYVFLGLISFAGIHLYHQFKLKRLILIPVLSVLVLINLLLFFYRVSTPAHKYMPYFRYVYEKAKNTREVQMYYDGFNMYGPYGLRITFYRPGNLVQLPLDEPSTLGQPLVSNNLFFQRGVMDEKYRRSIQSVAFSCTAWDMSAFQYGFSLPRKTKLNWNIYTVK